MKPLTHEWIEKAESDYIALCDLRASETPVFDAVCYHAQQCTEKYIKAVLQERDQRFGRTHDLVRLIKEIDPPLTGFSIEEEELRRLTEHAVAGRYPGYFADEAAADAAVEIAKTVRDACRRELMNV